jgi:hypothetical protein
MGDNVQRYKWMKRMNGYAIKDTTILVVAELLDDAPEIAPNLFKPCFPIAYSGENQHSHVLSQVFAA